MRRKQQGFTLVEIAVVLVIIGLLLGGILKGQEMIVQAKIKNAIGDFSGISAAYFGYQDRYRSMPGDDNQGTRWAGAIAGNGDRVLLGAYKDACPAVAVSGTSETCLWWDHLRRSGFVSGVGPVQPTNAFNGILGPQAGDGANPPVAVLLNPAGGIISLMLCSSNLPDKVAIALDVQMDDGVANTGAVRSAAAAPGNADVSAGVSSPASYVETGTTFFTLCRQF